MSSEPWEGAEGAGGGSLAGRDGTVVPPWLFLWSDAATPQLPGGQGRRMERGRACAAPGPHDPEAPARRRPGHADAPPRAAASRRARTLAARARRPARRASRSGRRPARGAAPGSRRPRRRPGQGVGRDAGGEARGPRRKDARGRGGARASPPRHRATVHLATVHRGPGQPGGGGPNSAAMSRRMPGGSSVTAPSRRMRVAIGPSCASRA